MSHSPFIRWCGPLGFLAALLACSDTTSPPPSSPDRPGRPAAVEQPGIPITDCYTVISQPGEYRLANDLLGCEVHYPPISIEASGVTLHLDGHRISRGRCLDVGSPAGIFVGGVSDATILGPGLIEWFYEPIGLHGTQRATIRGVTVHHGCEYALAAYGVSDLLVERSTFVTRSYLVARMDGVGIVFRDNGVFGGEYGIRLSGSANTVRGNVIGPGSDMGAAIGIDLQLGSGNLIAQNRISGISDGITIRLGSIGNRVVENTLRNVGLDLRDENACGENTWRLNRFTRADPDCLH